MEVRESTSAHSLLAESTKWLRVTVPQKHSRRATSRKMRLIGAERERCLRTEYCTTVLSRYKCKSRPGPHTGRMSLNIINKATASSVLIVIRH